MLWSPCAYLCYSHPLYGTPVIPKSLWVVAQTGERSVWKGAMGNSDRSPEHIEGFAGYSKLPEQLGDVIEVGSGPWTQTRSMLYTRPKSVVTSFTAVDPSANYYIENVPSCSYKTGRLAKYYVYKGFHDFPVHVYNIGGEALKTHPLTYDTLVSMNVIEHVQDAFSFLESLHGLLKPGGILVWHERWWNTPLEGNSLLEGSMPVHPIRVTQFVLNIFLKQFDLLYCNLNQTTDMIQRKSREKGFYVIAVKKTTSYPRS